MARGFEGEPELAQALMDRVRGWTGGHPYLTQKVARSVMRKGGKLEDVERVVREQLLAPGAAETDPFLNHVRSWLHADAPGARRTARLLRRLAHGRNVVAPADPLVLERLQLSGVVADRAAGGSSFAIASSKSSSGAGCKARGGSGAWPRPPWSCCWSPPPAATGTCSTCRRPTSRRSRARRRARPAVDDAYRRLHALPGFNERADRLYAAALVRRSGAADDVGRRGRGRCAPARFAGPGRNRRPTVRGFLDASPDRGQACRAAGRGVAVCASRGEPAGGCGRRRRQLAELVDADYPHLTRTLHLRGVPPVWAYAIRRFDAVLARRGPAAGAHGARRSRRCRRPGAGAHDGRAACSAHA